MGIHHRCSGLKLVLLCWFLVSAQSFAKERDSRTSAMFDEWASGHTDDIAAYRTYLHQQSVSDVVPMYQLLRTASDWNGKACKRVGAPPFQVPPNDKWAEMTKTLKLVAHLRQQGLLRDFEVVSAYRPIPVNRCAQSTGTRHPKNVALDLIPLGLTPIVAVGPLCRFYHSQGKKWAMGLSLYPTGRIHIDADGWRTWGESTHADTSVCNKPKVLNSIKKRPTSMQ